MDHVTATHPATSTVEALMSVTFDRPRNPRSNAYRAGCRAALAFRIDHVPIECPYRAGSAEWDAFHAGVGEGHRVARGVLGKTD